MDFRLTVMAHPETDLEEVVRPVAHPAARPVAVPGGGGGGGPPRDGGLDPPTIRPSGRPSGPDPFQCERCTGTVPTHLRRLVCLANSSSFFLVLQ